MRRNTLIVTCCYLYLLALTTCAGPHQSTATLSDSSGGSTTSAKTPPEAVVRASASEVEMQAGGSAEASVRLAIAEGYHINANPPTYPYLKATELTLAVSDGITMDQPTYPAPVTKKFVFAEKPLAVYEQEATIRVPLHAGHTASRGARALGAKIRVQACDDKACYPPQTVGTSIPVIIK